MFISALKTSDSNHQIAKDGIVTAEQGNLKIYTSAFTKVEVLHLGNITLEEKELITNFFNNRYITLIDITRYNADISFDIFWQEKLCHKDVVHIGSALHISEYVENLTFETFDEQILKKQTIKYKDSIVSIQKPSYQDSLF